MENLKFGFIGAGQMAQAIITGIGGAADITISGRDKEKTRATADRLGVTAVASNIALCQRCDVVILAVKPQTLPAVATEIRDSLSHEQPLVSLAAGLSLSRLASLVAADQPIFRVMPNTNAAIRRSTTAIARNAAATEAQFQAVAAFFEQVGSLHETPESDFASFAALAGSAPAFVYSFIDALARAAVLHGLTKADATQIAAEMTLASAQHLMDSPLHPQALADEVASPGGTTIEGLLELERQHFAGTLADAFTAMIDKEKKLSAS